MLKVGNKVFLTKLLLESLSLQSYDSSGELTQAKLQLQLPETAGLAGIGSAQQSSRTESTGAAGQKKTISLTKKVQFFFRSNFTQR
jgi:hypothetical protein